MRKIFFLLLLATSFTAFGQGKTIYSVSWVKPKIGMTTAFEAAWKAHVAKFHNGDDKRTVMEITSGDRAGSYMFVEGPMSYADMDVEKTNQTAHDADYDKTVAPTLAEGSGNYYYQYLDSLSFNTDVQGDKSIVALTWIKSGKMGDYRTEVKKGVDMSKKINSPFNNFRYQQLAAGSSPQMASVYVLKDGFKQLEQDYFKDAPNFRDNYVKMYGIDAWEARVKLLDEIVVKTEV
ncbi:MAG: hypothetical protein HYX40_10815, partial [Sphingobacteriales bacterium]|nr:hypothetical protein [Sphingobacteriales bacterium]